MHSPFSSLYVYVAKTLMEMQTRTDTCYDIMAFTPQFVYGKVVNKIPHCGWEILNLL